MLTAGNTVSTKRSDLDRILAKMNIQVDNPVCILNQETAKNFLHGNDSTAKYKLFERATQMDVIWKDFCTADEELSRSKSCLKEKLEVRCFVPPLNFFCHYDNHCISVKQSLECLRTEVANWKTKKEWYDAMNAVQDRKMLLENMVSILCIPAFTCHFHM